MALTKHRGIAIKAIVNVLPTQVIDNLELALIPEHNRSKLVEHTGIRFRRIANQTHQTVKQLFKKGIDDILPLTGWTSDDIDILICVTQTTKLNIPSTACQLHGDLNLPQHVICYDINSGCSGYVYGLQTVASILATINKKNPKAVLCCGDVSTHLLDPNDASTQPIFSDAVSVTAIEFDSNNQEITAHFNLETMGAGQHVIHSFINESNKNVMQLNGIDVFAYSLKSVPQNINALLDAAGMQKDEPVLYVLHQANKLINDAISKKLQLDSERVPQTLHQFGNTASASIPLTLSSCLEHHTYSNRWMLLCGFGVGFSVASVLIKLSEHVPHKTIEI